MENVKIKKNITIFYSRIEEKQIFLELERKLKLNGFIVRFSKNLNLKAVIGIFGESTLPWSIPPKKINEYFEFDG